MDKKTVIVLGGGQSASLHDLQNLRKDGYVIGVNDSAIHAPVDCAVTMDRTWFENRWEKIRALGLPLYAREDAVINVPDRWPGLHIFKNNRHSNFMTLEVGTLNGVNSGFCACNLAFQFQPDHFLPLGLDSKKGGYWYPPYEWQTGDAPRGLTSDWAYERWASGLVDIKQQFEKAGIEWI
jgi:hypothetical protein